MINELNNNGSIMATTGNNQNKCFKREIRLSEQQFEDLVVYHSATSNGETFGEFVRSILIKSPVVECKKIEAKEENELDDIQKTINAQGVVFNFLVKQFHSGNNKDFVSGSFIDEFLNTLKSLYERLKKVISDVREERKTDVTIVQNARKQISSEVVLSQKKTKKMTLYIPLSELSNLKRVSSKDIRKSLLVDERMVIVRDVTDDIIVRYLNQILFEQNKITNNFRQISEVINKRQKKTLKSFEKYLTSEIKQSDKRRNNIN